MVLKVDYELIVCSIYKDKTNIKNSPKAYLVGTKLYPKISMIIELESCAKACTLCSFRHCLRSLNEWGHSLFSYLN